MKVCYIDESGDLQALKEASQNVTPVCVILGLLVDQGVIQQLTNDFLTLKKRLFKGLLPGTSKHLAWMLTEIKGAELRKTMRGGMPRNPRRHTLNFLDRLMDMVEAYDIRLVGRVWVKGIAAPISDVAVYTFSVQSICEGYQRYLAEQRDTGIMIADSRTYAGNVGVSHSVLTQKYKLDGDQYDRLLEMPTFGHSNNHVGLQIADLLASALIFPMATYAYCRGHVQNVHVDEEFGALTKRYGERLQRRQCRFIDNDGRRRGGITVDDRLGQRSGAWLFKSSAA